jgi:hypothetical protein
MRKVAKRKREEHPGRQEPRPVDYVVSRSFRSSVPLTRSKSSVREVSPETDCGADAEHNVRVPAGSVRTCAIPPGPKSLVKKTFRRNTVLLLLLYAPLIHAPSRSSQRSRRVDAPFWSRDASGHAP